MDIVSRLKLYIDFRQIPVTQFADMCNIPRPSLSQLLNGRNKKVSDEVIGKIHSAFPDLSVLWLMFGEGDMVLNINAETLGSNPISKEPGYYKDTTQTSRNVDFETPLIGSSGANAASNATAVPKSSSRTSTPDSSASSWYSSGVMNDVASEIFPTQGFANQTRDTVNTDARKKKRVIRIIVYYDDNTFEPFAPDTTDTSLPIL